MESMKDCLRKEGTRMCPGKASVMRSLKDRWTEVRLARWRQRNQMAPEKPNGAVCIGGARRYAFLARRYAFSSQLAWASQLVEAPVICLEWHLLSLALLAQIPDHWKLHRHQQAASPWEDFCTAEGEEHLDAGRQLDCC